MNAQLQYYSGIDLFNKRQNQDITVKRISLRDKIEEELLNTFRQQGIQRTAKDIKYRNSKRIANITKNYLAEGKEKVKKIEGPGKADEKVAQYKKVARELGLPEPDHFISRAGVVHKLNDIGIYSDVAIKYKGKNRILGSKPLNDAIREQKLELAALLNKVALNSKRDSALLKNNQSQTITKLYNIKR